MSAVIDAGSIGVVLDALRPERAALLATLARLGDDDWRRPTECPAYDVKGVATHILGDDLSLLSRQRDEAENGLLQTAVDLPGADVRTLLDTFNDRWVLAARFLSPELLLELLRLAGTWTSDYYERVDPSSPGEPVAFFGSTGEPSPFWHAIAREYMERWVHHSQIRRALGLGSLADEPFVRVGVEVAAATAGATASRTDEGWAIGPVVLGPDAQAAAILTRGHTADEVQALATGPAAAVGLLAAFAGRP